MALWLSLTVVPALATQQEPDFITLDGERYWYSQALIMARGDVVRYLRDGGTHSPVFPLYTILFIKHGRIFKRMDPDYEGLELLKKERFEKYRGNDQLQGVADVVRWTDPAFVRPLLTASIPAPRRIR